MRPYPGGGAELGIAFLPCYMGDVEPNLQRLTPILPEFTFDVWILTHPETKEAISARANDIVTGVNPAPFIAPA